MPTCHKCHEVFPNRITIDGKVRNVSCRKYCVKCSPYGGHNTRPLDAKIPMGSEIICETCNRTFVKTRVNKGNHKCNSCRYGELRRKTKAELIALKGGKCCICGYCKSLNALQFHHKDPSAKEFHLSGNITYARKRVLAELEKCVLICANCHAELHGGLVNMPL